jgi:hypothetical protein
VIWAVSLSTTDLITRSLTPAHAYLEFAVYLDLVTPDGPLVQTELYLHYPLREASPKAISERTSYLQVRLEFHRYPQLIPAIFNLRGFGPPVRFTAPSTWSRVGHLVSGLHQPTQRPLQTRFRSGSIFADLTSLTNATRRFILQKARHYTLMCSDYL